MKGFYFSVILDLASGKHKPHIIVCVWVCMGMHMSLM